MYQEIAISQIEDWLNRKIPTYKISSWILGLIIVALEIWDKADENGVVIAKSWQFYNIVILTVTVGVLQWRQWSLDNRKKVAISELQRENEKIKGELASFDLIKQNIEMIFRCCLRDIAKSLEFSPNERISLYIILEEQFALCSRISSNPSYERQGRDCYPLDQGVIGRSWDVKLCFENEVPPYAHNNHKYSSYMQKKYLMPPGTTDKLTMKSHLYFGYRLHDHNEGNPVGIIVIESLTRNKYTESQLINTLSVDMEYLYEMIKTFKDYIPALCRATQVEGF